MKRLALLLLLAAASFAPSPVRALSCLPPNPARELDALLEKGLDMIVIRGTANRLSASPHAGSAKVGRYTISGEGADRVGSGSMTLEPEIKATCAGPWCADLPQDGIEAVFLVRRMSRTDLVIADPCAGGIYPLADGQENRLDGLSLCIAEGRCPKEVIDAMEFKPPR